MLQMKKSQDTPKSPNEIILEKSKKKISPEKYSDMLSHLELINIIVSDIKSSINRKLFFSNITEQPKINLDETSDIIEIKDNSSVLEVDYTITAKVGSKQLFNINIKYCVFFSHSIIIPKEFFVLYKTYSLPLQTYPYLRELVNSIISKMGFPPLILPLRKHLVGKSK